MRWVPFVLVVAGLPGCGPAHVPASVSSEVTASAKKTVLTLDTPAFKRYNEALDRTICELSGGTIIPGGMLTGVGDRLAFREELNRRIYAPLFEDADALAQSQAQVAEWANSVSQYQVDQRAAWVNVARGLAPKDQREQRIGAIHRTRKARWQRLATRIGMPVPTAFHLYRGVKGDFMAETLLKAWKDEGTRTFRIPHYTLSSWSLSEKTAFEFQAAWGAADPWIVFEAVVPFEQTLMDKWVDGGTFAETYPGQHEVVVATEAENELEIPDTQATIWFGRKRYTYADRAAFIQAWEARLAVSK